MPTVTQGSSAIVVVNAGKSLVVSSAGESYVDRLTALPDAGYASDRIVSGSKSYAALDVDFSVKVRAISGATDYIVAFPTVSSSDIVFRRADSGDIDALIDPKTGGAVSLGTGDSPSVAWGDVTGKPAVIGAGATAEAARAAIGAGTGNGTSNFSGAYDDLSGKPTLGTAAAMASTAFATAAQGGKADSAVQPAALTAYAKTADLPQGVAVPDAAAAPTMEEFNTLLASLRTGGIIAS